MLSKLNNLQTTIVPNFLEFILLKVMDHTVALVENAVLSYSG
jgi:hypothetical protein